MFKRAKFRRELAKGFQVQTAEEQTAVPERLLLDPEAPPKLRLRKPTARRVEGMAQTKGGILREACGGGYRIRRIGTSY